MDDEKPPKLILVNGKLLILARYDFDSECCTGHAFWWQNRSYSFNPGSVIKSPGARSDSILNFEAN